MTKKINTLTKQANICKKQVDKYLNEIDILPINKFRGFWDINEPCLYFKLEVLRVLSAMVDAPTILFIYHFFSCFSFKNRRLPSLSMFIPAFISLS